MPPSFLEGGFFIPIKFEHRPIQPADIDMPKKKIMLDLYFLREHYKSITVYSKLHMPDIKKEDKNQQSNTTGSKGTKFEFNKEESKGTELKPDTSGGNPIEMGGESILFPTDTPTAPVKKVEEKLRTELKTESVVNKVVEPEVVVAESDTEERNGSNGIFAFIAGVIIGAFLTSLFL